MKLKIFKLLFHTPLHLSRGKTGTYESSGKTLHSDKIKAALYATALQLFGQSTSAEPLSIADQFLLHLRLSSAFPFDENGYWLPKPLSFQPKINHPAERKLYKSVKYLTLAQFIALQNGTPPQGLLTTKQPSIWESEITQRVRIGYEEDSEPFYLEKLYAKPDSGLYFIAHAEETVDWEKFSMTLELLGENGIGLQRGLGNGHFTIQTDEIELAAIDAPKTWMALSLYRPEEQQEIAPVLEESYCQFIKRGGWISAPESEAHLSLRKKSVLFFLEGSVFAFDEPAAELICKGKADINLQPVFNGLNHPIWRDGRALFLPL